MSTLLTTNLRQAKTGASFYKQGSNFKPKLASATRVPSACNLKKRVLQAMTTTQFYSIIYCMLHARKSIASNQKQECNQVII